MYCLAVIFSSVLKLCEYTARKLLQKKTRQIFNFYRSTIHSGIRTVHSPTDAHLLKL